MDTRYQDHREVRPSLLDGLGQFSSCPPGHHLVGEDQVHRLFTQGPHGVRGRSSGQHLVPLRFEDQPPQGKWQLFIVNTKNERRISFQGKLSLALRQLHCGYFQSSSTPG
jgi:hypothetical protein